jgi:glucose-1-phosphate cytidylyltransferase
MIEFGGMPFFGNHEGVFLYGFNDFIVCAGYKQQIIKDWFANYFLHTSDVTFDFAQGNKIIVHNQHSEPWKGLR